MGLASKGNERPENNYGSREPEYSHPACIALHASSIAAECLPGVATRELWKELRALALAPGHLKRYPSPEYSEVSQSLLGLKLNSLITIVRLVLTVPGRRAFSFPSLSIEYLYLEPTLRLNPARKEKVVR